MSSNFTVYNASAGSGKTYTIVKEYLKIVLSSSSPFKYQQILAITFTNKAAGEMKERIFNQLREFGNFKPSDKPSDLLLDLEKELQIDRDVLVERAKNVSSQILHDYSKFNISTIDKFTHKLIRTFSFDLGLPVNFDVEMNVSNVLADAVDILISKIGDKEDLTNALVNFSIRNLKDGKSWDIAFALKDISTELFKEDSVDKIEELKKYSIKDFIALAKTLRELEKDAIEELKKIGNNALDLIYASGLEDNMFSYGAIPKYFNECKDGKFEIEIKPRVPSLFEKEQLYSKSKSKQPWAQTIDSIFSDLQYYFNSSRKWVETQGSLVILIRLILRNIDSVTVLNEIEKELSEIKRHNNILFNSEFNKRISDEIKDQPVPYIYERLGDKFQYFFVDEFQDTSVLQWQNLIPLIENSIASGGDCVIVGDGKQAIYRWRGGKAEQFIDLSQQKVSFPFEITPATLDKNYRSYSHIIDFSNDFFKFTSNAFSNESYSEMYLDGNNQKTNNKVGGYVEIEFFEKNDVDDFNEQNNTRTEVIIRDLLHEGYSLKDICILTRNNKEGVSVSNYLIENGIEVISKESLLIKNNEQVDFCIQSLKLINYSDDFDARLKAIEYLIASDAINVENYQRHDVYSKFVKLSTEKFYSELKKYGIIFDVNSFLKLPFYDAIEEFIRTFNLAENASIEIQFFLDFVLEFTSKNNTGINSFLEHWEDKKEKLSLVIPEGLDAVQVMTIHKSKGLEFPIVIFPYANWSTNDRNAKTWIPLENAEENFNGIKNALVSINKDLASTPIGENIYSKHENEVILDNLNLLYVALTRPVQRLYVITYKDRYKKLSEYFDGYLTSSSNYISEQLKSKDEKYWFGDKVFVPTENDSSTKKYELENLNSYKWINRVRMSLEAPKFWNIGEVTESEYGNLVHSILAEINYTDDKEAVLEKQIFDGNITSEISEKIKLLVDKVVLHTELKQYFTEEFEVKNEQDIILSDKTILRPDRVVIKNNNAIVIDYKTGARIEKHDEQINTYGVALEELGYFVDKKLLVYLKDEVDVVEV
ncbi:MAG: UvrD-helicase domain-containing protein [Flavobacteriales bacterium]|nr:UvrD-helicase domain-containing protein [Flavobacteriales bacterium]